MMAAAYAKERAKTLNFVPSSALARVGRILGLRGLAGGSLQLRFVLDVLDGFHNGAFEHNDGALSILGTTQIVKPFGFVFDPGAPHRDANGGSDRRIPMALPSCAALL